MRIAAALAFVTVFVPISLYRRVTASSRFGSRFHHGPSAWDQPSTRKQ